MAMNHPGGEQFALDARILDAALEVLSSAGYSAMSMDAIAERAAVSKPTIYRRWKTKLDLAMACISRMATSAPLTTEQDVWLALEAELELFGKALARDHGMSIIATVIGLEDREPEMVTVYRERVVQTRRARFHAVFRRGIAEGRLPADFDTNLALNMMLGYFYASYISGDDQPDDWPARCVALVRRATLVDTSQTIR